MNPSNRLNPALSLLRLGRVTKFLPAFKGLSLLLRIYRKCLPANTVFRINDFDGNLKFDVDICETSGINLWHVPRLYERRERQLFCSAIHPGATVLDVGANLGMYSLLAAKRGARVFAIEADPRNAAILRHHLETNGFSSQVTVFEMAASDRPAEMRFFRNPANSGGTSAFGKGEPFAVSARTIDSLALPSIDVCKMDIEGSESLALQGMQETLSRSLNMKLLIEYSEAFPNAAQLKSLLFSNFSSVAVVGGKSLGPSDQFPPHCNLWATR